MFALRHTESATISERVMYTAEHIEASGTPLFMTGSKTTPRSQRETGTNPTVIFLWWLFAVACQTPHERGSRMWKGKDSKGKQGDGKNKGDTVVQLD